MLFVAWKWKLLSSFTLVFFLQWSSDQPRNQMNFLFYWVSNPGCIIVYGFFLHFTFLWPLILMFTSFARLPVIQTPIDTRLKDKEFVSRTLAYLGMSCIFACHLFTFLIWFVDIHHKKNVCSFILCSPFIDQSRAVLIIEILTWTALIYQVTSIIFIATTHIKMPIAL